MWRRDPNSAPKPPEPTGQLLASFPRDNGASEVRWSLAEFKGHLFVGVRVWTRGEGGFWPTKVGITVRAKHELAAVIEALQRAQAIIEGDAPAEPLEGQQELPWAEPRYVEKNRRPVARDTPGPEMPVPARDAEPFDELG